MTIESQNPGFEDGMSDVITLNQQKGEDGPDPKSQTMDQGCLHEENKYDSISTRVETCYSS